MPKPTDKPIYTLTQKQVLAKFSGALLGLSDEEAEKRLKEFGRNVIKKKRNWKWVKIVLNQFNDILVWILLVAGVLALAFGEYRDAAIIGIIILVNASMGFFQEWKAERILAGIKKLTKDRAIVIRSGEKKEIDTARLVPGDMVYIGEGETVPADGYLVESYSLKVNSVIFTGESKPKAKEAKVIQGKNIVLADMDNMVFMGETVAVGEGKFIVTGTGMATQLGNIVHLISEVPEELTPMQKKMKEMGLHVSILAVTIGVLVIIAGQYFRVSLYQNFLFALALAVSVVPEGLPAAISVALSLGMKRLLKRNVLAKKLNAVETLGSVSIICTDKTGTMTRNEMMVVSALTFTEKVEIDGQGYDPGGNFLVNGKKIDPASVKGFEALFKIGALCNDANIVREDGHYKAIGDPTEGAIVAAAKKYNFREDFFTKGERKITENPFSSQRRRMSVVYKNKSGRAHSYVKGSPDVLLELCTHVLKEGKICQFTSEEKELVRRAYNSMSQEALRVLAFGYRDLEGTEKKNYLHEAEKNLVWVGMMAMIDPPRLEVREAIVECKKLGIRVIMITGDYELTAEAIAKKAGLIGDGVPYEILNGRALDTLKDREIYKKISRQDVVFARIAPEQKLRIATILKNNREVIAMTGDGVNDAPALKKADIGVAMGIMGTDVSKESADMILLDDNFASIVSGIKEGRVIFSNLKKFVHYVFTSNASELITVLMGVLFQIPSPLLAVQILAIDLGTDVLPSFSLGVEPPEPEQKVRSRKLKSNVKEGILGLKGFQRIIYIGTIMATGAVIAFIWSMMRGGWWFGESFDPDSTLYIKSTAAAYAVLSMSQMANLLQSRSETLSPFQLGFFKNKYAIASIFFSLGVLLLFMYLPFCQKYLHMLPIDYKDWMMVAGTTIAVFLFEEVRKAEK